MFAGSFTASSSLKTVAALRANWITRSRCLQISFEYLLIKTIYSNKLNKLNFFQRKFMMPSKPMAAQPGGEKVEKNNFVSFDWSGHGKTGRT